MIARKLYELTARRPCRLIYQGDRPYLERYYIAKWLGWTVYLHRFVGSDGDRGVHDHPWRVAIALCLVGAYLEERVLGLCPLTGWVAKLRRVKAGRVNVLKGDDFHRITETRPETWTLFIHGPRWKGWGFLHKQKPDQHGHTVVVYHQPFKLMAGKAWWEDAPTGASAGREPFNGGA